LTFRRCAGG